jgi:hypothetical protein
MSPEDKDGDNHPLLEAFLENAEAGVDLITQSEVLAAVPVVGTAFNVMRGINDIRARAFISKLAAFVTDPSLQSEAARSQMRERASKPSKESRKIGETLFLVLERLTDMEKPALLSKVFASYLAGAITAEELRRLAPAIDAAFVDDIRMLVASPATTEAGATMWMRVLMPAGLSEQGVPGPIGGRLVFRLTPLGETLRKALTVYGN